MGQVERFIEIQRLLGSGRTVSRRRLLGDLYGSLSTLKRDIKKLNDAGWVIEWDPVVEGWRAERSGEMVAGLHLTPDEAVALLTMQHLLEQLDMGGMLARHLQPIGRKLDRIARQATGTHGTDLRRHLRVAHVAARKVRLPCFKTIADALLARRRLHIRHRARGRDDATSEREVSPQRLIHYRGNWYLDAWCHAKDALRSFAVDAVEAASMLDAPAIEMAEEDLDEVLGAGYGIFAGDRIEWAKLRFSVERSRWVANESWHPDQRGAFDAQGRWVLEVPYADPRELVMDVLRHVPEVEVLGPAGLKEIVVGKLGMGIRTVVGGSLGELGVGEDRTHG
jgi:predicted DNA-binding transcriptional regulator YafY